MSELTVDLQNVFDGPGVPAESLLQTWAQAAWLEQDPSEVTIRIVGIDESRALNHQ